MHKILPLSFLASIIFLSGCASSHTQTTELPVSKVVMYQNGVGYMERLGKVEGDELVLRVQTDQINDILKSLTVIDRGTGKPISISLPVDSDTLSSLAQIPNQIKDGGGILQLLEAFRGAHVRVKCGVSSYEGRVVGIEDLLVSDPPASSSVFEKLVTIANDDKLYVVNVKDITKVELFDRSLSVGLDKSLDMSLSEGDWKPVEFRIRMDKSATRDVQLSYIVAMPTWKPAYRLILNEDNSALLQGWAVISNVSGSDWKNIAFSLISGQPMSFTYDLYRPHFLERADLSDQMQTRAIAPKIQSSGYDARSNNRKEAGSFGLGAMKSAPAAAQSTRGAARMSMKQKAAYEDYESADIVYEEAKPEAMMMNYDEEYSITADDYLSNFDASVSSTQVGSLYEYKLDGKLTIPDGSSALVNLIQTNIASSETRMFEPYGGLQSVSYHNVQITNDTDFDLEPGPITIYKNGAFVGEGFLSKTSPGAVAQVTFAAESRIQFKRTESEISGDSTLRQIKNGRLTANIGRILQYKYTLTNNAAESLNAGIQILRDSFWTPKDFPEGTITSNDRYTVPVRLEANSQKEFELSMLGSNTESMRLISERGYETVATALKIQEFDPEIRNQLEEFVSTYRSKQDLDSKVQAVEKRKSELQADGSQITHSLQELKDVKSASGTKLKEQLIRRQSTNEKELSKLSEELAELRVRSLELDVKFKEITRTLEFVK